MSLTRSSHRTEPSLRAPYTSQQPFGAGWKVPSRADTLNSVRPRPSTHRGEEKRGKTPFPLSRKWLDRKYDACVAVSTDNHALMKREVRSLQPSHHRLPRGLTSPRRRAGVSGGVHGLSRRHHEAGHTLITLFSLHPLRLEAWNRWKASWEPGWGGWRVSFSFFQLLAKARKSDVLNFFPLRETKLERTGITKETRRRHTHTHHTHTVGGRGGDRRQCRGSSTPPERLRPFSTRWIRRVGRLSRSPRKRLPRRRRRLPSTQPISPIFHRRCRVSPRPPPPPPPHNRRPSSSNGDGRNVATMEEGFHRRLRRSLRNGRSPRRREGSWSGSCPRPRPRRRTLPTITPSEG